MAATTLKDVDVQLRTIIHNLYVLIVQAHDYQGPGTQQAMQGEIKELLQNLIHLSKTAATLPTTIPLEIIQYVESGRNPDIYTRDFVEVVMKHNQALKGRSEALAQFRDILSEQIVVGVPDMKEDVRKAVEVSGGRVGRGLQDEEG